MGFALRLTLATTLLTALVACGPGENEPGPGGVTVGEARDLDTAAAAIEAARLPDDAISPTPPGTGAAPPAKDGGPAAQAPAS